MGRCWDRLPRTGTVVGLVLLGAGLYLGSALALAGSPGFPLDDSWIHQTLARSLVREGRFAVNPGEATAASTAPLWTVLLAAGHRLGLAPFWWSHLLGGLLLGASAAMTATLARRLFPQEPSLAFPAALLVVLEWRLVWAAFSGMETLLFTALTLALLVQAIEARRPDWRLGLTGGLATLARPEGSVLFGLALLARLLSGPDPQGGGLRTRRRDATSALAVFGLVLAPYVAYHLLVLGFPLPATFQAKGAFYQQALTVPFVFTYLGRAAAFFVSGPFLLLAPGAAYLLAGQARRLPEDPKQALRLLPAVWVLGLVLLYLVWLPALYHHGRYLMPALPVAVLYGLAGTAHLLRLPFRLLPRLGPALAAAFTLALWANGAVVYGWDVRYITDQQVAVAHWLRRATPLDAVVATHDIGAMGYFAERRVVDLVGLITPELSGTAPDREGVLATLRQRGVTAAAVFPSWYPWLLQDPHGEEVYRAAADYVVPVGGDEMRVLAVHW